MSYSVYFYQSVLLSLSSVTP